MRIGELAARTGVSARSLRYYEQQGLLTSTRSAGGHRRYTDDDAARVYFIQNLYTANLSSTTIAELMPCAESPSTHNSDVALQRMAQERDKITAQIRDLQQARDALDNITATARAHRASLQHTDAATAVP